MRRRNLRSEWVSCTQPGLHRATLGAVMAIFFGASAVAHAQINKSPVTLKPSATLSTPFVTSKTFQSFSRHDKLFQNGRSVWDLKTGDRVTALTYAGTGVLTRNLGWHRIMPDRRKVRIARVGKPDFVVPIKPRLDSLVSCIVTTPLSTKHDALLFQSSVHDVDTFEIWDVTTGKQIGSFREPGIAEDIEADGVLGRISVSPNGRFLVWLRQGDGLRIVDLITGKRHGRLDWKYDDVPFAHRIFAWAPRSDRLAGINDEDGTITVWDIAERRKLSTFVEDVEKLRHGSFGMS